MPHNRIVLSLSLLSGVVSTVLAGTLVCPADEAAAALAVAFCVGAGVAAAFALARGVEGADRSLSRFTFGLTLALVLGGAVTVIALALDFFVWVWICDPSLGS